MVTALFLIVNERTRGIGLFWVWNFTIDLNLTCGLFEMKLTVPVSETILVISIVCIKNMGASHMLSI